MITGVAQVQVLGAQKYAVHVQMDPHALASRQIGINEVETALKNWNVNLPTGTIIGPQRAFTLQATGQLMSADAVPVAGGGLSQRIAGAPGGAGQRDRQRGGRQDRVLVLHARQSSSAPSCSPSSASRAPTPSR